MKREFKEGNITRKDLLNLEGEKVEYSYTTPEATLLEISVQGLLKKVPKHLINNYVGPYKHDFILVHGCENLHRDHIAYLNRRFTGFDPEGLRYSQVEAKRTNQLRYDGEIPLIRRCGGVHPFAFPGCHPYDEDEPGFDEAKAAWLDVMATHLAKYAVKKDFLDKIFPPCHGRMAGSMLTIKIQELASADEVIGKQGKEVISSAIDYLVQNGDMKKIGPAGLYRLH